MELFARLDEARERWNLLRHPFYQRWSEGRLKRAELGHYAAQYRDAVCALAEQTAACARVAEAKLSTELARHAAEEHAHVELWDEFATAVEAPSERAPDPETARCTEALTAGEDLLERLAVLYAVEASQPAVAQTKLDGLVEHYGVEADSPAAAYFALHAVRDHDHAAHSRELIASRVEPADEERLIQRAEAALAGNWALLDGVETRRPESVRRSSAGATPAEPLPTPWSRPAPPRSAGRGGRG